MRGLRRRRGLRLGVVSNEFFDPALGWAHPSHGRMGGFGWAASRLAECFADPADSVEVVFVSCEHTATPERGEVVSHGVRLLLRHEDERSWLRVLRRERFDALVCIDYRSSYLPVLRGLRRTPALIW